MCLMPFFCKSDLNSCSQNWIHYWTLQSLVNHVKRKLTSSCLWSHWRWQSSHSGYPSTWNGRQWFESDQRRLTLLVIKCVCLSGASYPGYQRVFSRSGEIFGVGRRPKPRERPLARSGAFYHPRWPLSVFIGLHLRNEDSCDGQLVSVSRDF